MEFPYDFTSDYHNTIFHFAPIFLCLYAIRYLLMPVTEIPLLPLFRLPFFFRRLLLSYLFLFPFSSPSSIDFFFYFFLHPSHHSYIHSTKILPPSDTFSQLTRELMVAIYFYAFPRLYFPSLCFMFLIFFLHFLLFIPCMYMCSYI